MGAIAGQARLNIWAWKLAAVMLIEALRADTLVGPYVALHLCRNLALLPWGHLPSNSDAPIHCIHRTGM